MDLLTVAVVFYSVDFTGVPQARHNFGVVEIDGILYILGGEDGERELISMESYDIYSRTWTKQPDLTMVRKVRAPSYLTTLFTGKELMNICI